MDSAPSPCGECHLRPGEICDICGAQDCRFRVRIVEVLRKYNIELSEAPLDALGDGNAQDE